jgi:O-methyltransferase involved in polyketide biosynthesis
MTYRLSRHAGIRASERGITNDDVIAALAGREMTFDDDCALYYDRRSRTLVIVENGVITTMYRLSKKTLKKRFSR